MGRPPSNGGPSFRFNQAEVTEMEAILQAHHTAMPAREVLISLADKFSATPERNGKIKVQMKQVWNWFQNRRYALRAKAAKAPGKLVVSPMSRDNSAISRNGPQAPTNSLQTPSATAGTLSQAPQHPPASSGRSPSENSQMEFEAKSARDGACFENPDIVMRVQEEERLWKLAQERKQVQNQWYDVATFLSHRSLESGDPEVLVRFSGFGAEEDEWVNIRKHVRQRSLPCESSECVAVLPGDLILCFQEGKEQALYFDAHVLDAQRRRHDVRGCRCRFLVRYDHDQSEEIVALRKICRRPETDYRLQQLHALNESASMNQNKTSANIHMGSTLRVYPPVEAMPKPVKVEAAVTALQSSLPGSTETKLQPRVEPVVLAPHNNLPEASETKLQHRVEPVVLAPQNNLPPVSEGEAQRKVEPVVPAPSDCNLAEVSEAKAQQKVEVVGPNQPEVSEGIAQQKADPMVPAPTSTSVPEASEGKVDHEVEHMFPEATEGKVDLEVEHMFPEASEGKVDIEVQNTIEPVVAAPSLPNVPEVVEIKVLQPDVEMLDAEKEPNSNIPPDNAVETSVAAITTGSDQKMQEAS